MFFSVVFQASTGKKLREKKITEKIMGPGNLMLNMHSTTLTTFGTILSLEIYLQPRQCQWHMPDITDCTLQYNKNCYNNLRSFHF